MKVKMVRRSICIATRTKQYIQGLPSKDTGNWCNTNTKQCIDKACRCPSGSSTWELSVTSEKCLNVLTAQRNRPTTVVPFE